MPAVSKQQQKFMGLVLAYKRGEVPASKVSKNVKQVAAAMSEKELEKFAGTKHKGLPKKAEGVELEEAMTLGGVKLSAKAQEEVKKYNLQNNQEYIKRLEMYADSYSKRKPTGTAAKNMLRALRMMTYKNTPDDWARLHATEYFMRKRTESMEVENTIPVRESIDQSTVKKIRERIEKTVRSLMREGEGVDGGEEKKEPTLTPEQKALYTELIRKYNQYGESIYREGRLRETYKNIKKIVEFASKNIVDESGDWFDGVTVSRHSRKMNESFKIFEKTVMEITKLQQRLESVYEEIGETLSRYYEIESDDKKEPMVTETDGEGIFYAFWNQQKHEIKAKDAYAAKLAAIEKFKIPKSKQGLLAVMSKRAYDDQEFRFR